MRSKVPRQRLVCFERGGMNATFLHVAEPQAAGVLMKNHAGRHAELAGKGRNIGGRHQHRRGVVGGQPARGELRG